MESSEKFNAKKTVSQTIDFYKIFKVFLSRWYWVVGCVIVALIIARINLLYTPPIYVTSGQLKLQQDNPSAMGAMNNNMGPQSYSFTDKIQAEGFVIKSSEVISNAIQTLNYKITYYLKSRFITAETYPNIPFTIEIIKQDSLNFGRDIYEVLPVDQQRFKISLPNQKSKPVNYKYGQNIAMGNMIFKITSPIPSTGTYQFKFNSKEDFIGRVSSGLRTEEAGRFTNVMSVIQTDVNPYFAADILNAMMKEYVSYDILQRKRSAKQTVDFIRKQLGFIDTAASRSGSNLADFKTKNKIVDMSSAGSMTVSKLAEFEKQKMDLRIQQLGIVHLERQVNNKNAKVEIGLDVDGVLSSSIGALVTQLNTAIANRQADLTQFTPNSRPILEHDRQIESLQAAIKANIRSISERNQKTVQFINNQIGSLNQDISKIPAKDQSLVKLSTDFEVNNKVRSYLSEKQLEAELNEASVVPAASIVNPAFPADPNYPMSPDKKSAYVTAILFGLAAGFGLILLVRFLNPYIYDKETVESLTSTPIIGVIRQFPGHIDADSRQALSLSKPKSVFAESVRSVRTNLSFLASHKKSKTICITSEVSGEGKSFVTVNLAGTLALIDKKVILIAADLRKSKLHKAFGSDNKQGLSSYLSGQKTLEEVIIHDDMHNIDFIPSGPVPPNPSELLHTDSMKRLLEIVTPHYDYVLIDTAPVGLVSDAIPLIRQSDVNIFVIRSGKSQYRAAAIPERLSREYGLSNLAIVLNAFGDDALHSNYYTTDYSQGGGTGTYYYSDYSGYAGSGYYEDPKKWWQFWKKKD